MTEQGAADLPWLGHLPAARAPEVRALVAERRAWAAQDKPGFLRFRQPMATIAHLRARWCDFSGDVVRIGAPDEISAAEREAVAACMRSFMPWRKGPFSVFGIDIDAEWRSERKWQRVLPALPDLEGLVIADIGCNNGYYMFRMAHHRPRLVLGFEPHPQHYFTFTCLNRLAGREELAVELLGVEHLHLFPGCFDLIFLMGIVYHRPSPIDTLRGVLAALKPGGRVIVESLAVPGQEHTALFPAGRYAKAPGVWFVPTGPCLVNWMERCGFTDVRLFDSRPMSPKEQRRTPWMTFESYEDFIDKADSRFTVEGYPAPWRVCVSATKKPARREP